MSESSDPELNANLALSTEHDLGCGGPRTVSCRHFWLNLTKNEPILVSIGVKIRPFGPKKCLEGCFWLNLGPNLAQNEPNVVGSEA